DPVQAQKALSVMRRRAEREEADEVLTRVNRVTTAADLPTGLDLAVEAVPERLELKRAVLAGIEERAPALLATSTSSISISDLAPGLRRPESFLGLHFFNPVWRMPLVEIVRGDQTGPAAVSAAADSIAMLGKDAIVVR